MLNGESDGELISFESGQKVVGERQVAGIVPLLVPFLQSCVRFLVIFVKREIESGLEDILLRRYYCLLFLKVGD